MTRLEGELSSKKSSCEEIKMKLDVCMIELDGEKEKSEDCVSFVDEPVNIYFTLSSFSISLWFRRNRYSRHFYYTNFFFGQSKRC